MFLIALTLLFVTVSCETELTYLPEESPSSFVLYSFLENDSIFTFHISKTATINSTSASYLAEDGIISLYENGVLVNQIPYYATSNWVAMPLVKITHSKDYKVTYESPNSPMLTAKTVVPKPIAISDVDTLLNTQLYASLADTMMPCEIVFNDSILIPNNYQLVVKTHILNEGSSLWQISDVDFVKSDDLFFTSIEVVGGLGSGIDFEGLFTDNSIDGKNYRLKCQVPRDLFYLNDGESAKRVEFVLYSLSSDYYQYYKSRKFIEGYSGVPFLNPVISYSNVSNGLGCVSGLSSSSYFVEAQ